MAKTNELDQFANKIFKLGSSLAIIIPKKNVDFAGLKSRDIIKVYFKKIKR